MSNDLFELPSQQFAKRLLKYDESKHPRDSKGRWAAAGATIAGGAVLGAVLGVPGLRSLPGLRHLRNKVLGLRTTAARRASTPGAVLARMTPGSPEADLGRLGAQYVRGRHANPFVEATRSQLRRRSPASARRRHFPHANEITMPNGLVRGLRP